MAKTDKEAVILRELEFRVVIRKMVCKKPKKEREK